MDSQLVQPLTLLLLLLSSSLFLGARAQQQNGNVCTVCRDGRDVLYPEKPLNVDGIPVKTCGELALTAGLLPSSSDYCLDSVQVMGTLCGCPIPEGACTLCEDGSTPLNATLSLPNYRASDYIAAAPPNVFLTCESMEALLHNQQKTESTCLSIQQDVANECGCPSTPTTETAIPPTPMSPSISVAPSVTPREPCKLCRGENDSILYPNKPLDLGDLPIDTCADLDGFAALLTADTSECIGIQSLGPLCGCSIPVDSRGCTLCPNGERPSRPNRPLNWFSVYGAGFPDTFDSIGDALTCEVMESILSIPAQDVWGLSTNFICMSVHLKSHLCGCSPDWRHVAMTVFSRVSGALSLFGSCSIIYDILFRRRRRHTTYHQIVLGISISDLFSSVAYILSTTMTPVESGLYLAMGNRFTCKLQGFMVQLGNTSMIYNLCLSSYFFLVILCNWKEHQFERLHLRVHLVVLLIGIGMACGGIPYYGEQYNVCHILPPPAWKDWWPVTLFYTVPVSLVLVMITSITTTICVRVYQQQLASMQWSTKQNVRLSRQVFWQSFWYMMAFYITFPYLFMTFYWPRDKQTLTIFLIGALLAPSQGFLNALIYFQRSGLFNKRIGSITGSLVSRVRRFSLRVTTNVLKRSSVNDFRSSTFQGVTASKHRADSINVDSDDDMNDREDSDDDDEEENDGDDVVEMGAVGATGPKRTPSKDPSCQGMDRSDRSTSRLGKDSTHTRHSNPLPPPPPPPPPDHHSPLIEWLRYETSHHHRRTSLLSDDDEESDEDWHDDECFDNGDGKDNEAFAGTREFFFLNYIDDIDDDEGVEGQRGSRAADSDDELEKNGTLAPPRSPWARLRKSFQGKPPSSSPGLGRKDSGGR